MHTQCDILLLATSAAFSFAGLQCVCPTAWCRYPHTKPEAGVMLQFPRKCVAQLPPVLPGSSIEASFEFTTHSLQKRWWNQERGKVQINEQVLELHLTKQFVIQTRGEAASAVSPRCLHTPCARAAEEIPIPAVVWAWMLSVPMAATHLPQHVSMATDPPSAIQQLQELPALLWSCGR